jgi:hypothetical protein
MLLFASNSLLFLQVRLLFYTAQQLVLESYNSLETLKRCFLGDGHKTIGCNFLAGIIIPFSKTIKEM